MSTKLNFEDLILVKAMYNEELSRAILKKDKDTIVRVMEKITQDVEYEWYDINYDNINLINLAEIHKIDIRDFVACYEN